MLWRFQKLINIQTYLERIDTNQEQYKPDKYWHIVAQCLYQSLPLAYFSNGKDYFSNGKNTNMGCKSWI